MATTTTSSEGKWDESRLISAFSQLDEVQIWTPYTVKPFYSLANRWDVDRVLDHRRSELARQQVIRWINNERCLRKIYTTPQYDQFSSDISGIPELLSEYDNLNPKVTRQHKDWELYGSAAEIDWELLDKSKTLKMSLEKAGIKVDERNKLIEILTNFEKERHLLECDHISLATPECPLLQPTAAYIATPEIQSSFLTRYMAQAYLCRLRDEMTDSTKRPNLYTKTKVWAAIAILLLLRPTTDWLGLSIANFWPLAAGIAAYLAWGIYKTWFKFRAKPLLERLIAQFQVLDEPATIDGRELTSELRRLQTRKIFVPSLLFSLFSLILPGV
ncbi:MAG: hypothetical protein P4L10_14620 [Acidobacteriaceae bacterium]|nr:hypothetical protein [Acidobacteriaceae bacterium]